MSGLGEDFQGAMNAIAAHERARAHAHFAPLVAAVERVVAEGDKQDNGSWIIWEEAMDALIAALEAAKEG